MRALLKFFKSYYLVLVSAGLITLYLVTNISKRRQLNIYQKRLDSTTVLLDKIAQLQAENQTKVLKIRDALFDTTIAVSFDTTATPVIRTANNRKDTTGKVITSFLGNANAETVVFGPKDYCTFSIDMKDIKMSLRLNKSRDTVQQALVQSYAVEKVIECKVAFNPALPQQQLYNLLKYTFNRDTLIVDFTPSEANQPKCSVKFKGILVGNKISGNLIWQRYDMKDVPEYNYTITVPITLY